MKSTKTLVLILRVLGWLSIAGGVIFLILAVISPVTIYFKLVFLLLKSIPGFLGGLILLCLAHGLSKEEKWSWYIGFIVFSLSLFLAIISLFLGIISITVVFLFSVVVDIVVLSELVAERELFTKKPKEKISQWFRKPCFIGVVVGILLLCFDVGILTYLNYNLAKEVRRGLEKTISANEYIQKAETELAEIKRGDAVETEQHVSKAVEYGKTATDLEPNNPEIWFRRGNIYWEIIGMIQGAEEWALKCYERALELDLDNQLYRQKLEELTK